MQNYIYVCVIFCDMITYTLVTQNNVVFYKFYE